ncbi:hypothetical protein [Selenomonas ruminis]|uniref:Uncharacterized protein n=1 Tax=Selenomonas ruminis TaxID=2593411 RepID=A0A5D6WCH8_9FIRM|nr:hypothetical protein [Selenomonas sp. mPRGC5]TYZ24518.1 hypothetical protein FZ040_00265 [Selenomonas sp. mPRGC5]
MSMGETGTYGKANLYAAERTCIDVAAEKEVDTHKIFEDINMYVSQLIVYLPYNGKMLCDEVYCLAKDNKAVTKEKNSGSAEKLLYRIRAQENKCRVILKFVWIYIK